MWTASARSPLHVILGLVCGMLDNSHSYVVAQHADTHHLGPLVSALQTSRSQEILAELHSIRYECAVPQLAPQCVQTPFSSLQVLAEVPNMLRFKGPLVQLGSAPKSQAYQPRTPTRGQVTPFQLQFEVTRLMEDELRNEKVARSRAVIVKASNDMARALPGFREVRGRL